jgi:hypothetical protein
MNSRRGVYQKNEIITFYEDDLFESINGEFTRRRKLNKTLPIGSFNHVNGTPTKAYSLLPLSKEDKDEFSHKIDLKSGDIVCRCSSETMEISGAEPLIKVNLKYCMVYFMINDDPNNIKFETRGNKLTYLNLRQDYKELI